MNNSTTTTQSSSLPPEFYTIIFSLLASGGTYLVKGLFEKYNNYVLDKKTIIRKERFTRLKDKLSTFYWPIYIKLLRAEQLWVKISNVDKIEETFRQNNSDHPPEPVDSLLNAQTTPHQTNYEINLDLNSNHSTENHIGVLGGFVPQDNEDLAAFKIQRCFKNNYFDKKRKKMSKISRILSTNNDSKHFDLSISLNDFGNDIEKNLHSLDFGNKLSNINLRLTAGFLKTCDRMLLDIHLEIARIIDSRIAIAEPNNELSLVMLQYIRHITLYKLLRESKEYNIWPHDFGEAYPSKLKQLIEKETFALQKEYNSMMQIKIEK